MRLSFSPVSAVTNADVYHLDKHREDNSEVDVAFGDVLVEAFEEDHETDEDKEPECQYLHRRVLLNEFTNGSREYDHDTDRKHHGDNHDDNVIGKAYRGKDRVEREDDVKEYDLYDDTCDIYFLFST